MKKEFYKKLASIELDLKHYKENKNLCNKKENFSKIQLINLKLNQLLKNLK